MAASPCENVASVLGPNTDDKQIGTVSTSVLPDTNNSKDELSNLVDSSITYKKDLHVVELSQSLKMLRESNLFCDVEFSVGQIKIPAHKCVLAACSKRLKSRFGEKDSEDKINQVELLCAPQVVLEILNYVYLGHLTIGLENIRDICQVAIDLDIEGVLSMCCKHIEDSVNVDNWNTLYTLAVELGLDVALDSLKRFSVTCFASLASNNKFSHIPFEYVKRIFEEANKDRDPLLEVMKLKEMLKWIEYENPRSIHLEELLSLVDVDCISQISTLTSDMEDLNLSNELLQNHVFRTFVLKLALPEGEININEHISTESLRDSKIESLPRDEIKMNEHPSTESLEDTKIDSLTRDELETNEHPPIESLEDPKVDSLTRDEIETYEHPSTESLEDSKVDSLSRDEIETNEHPSTESLEDPKVDSLTRDEIEIHEHPSTESLEDSKVDSLIRDEIETNEHTSTESLENPKIESLTRDEIETIEHPPTESPKDSKFESVSYSGVGDLDSDATVEENEYVENAHQAEEVSSEKSRKILPNVKIQYLDTDVQTLGPKLQARRRKKLKRLDINERTKFRRAPHTRPRGRPKKTVEIQIKPKPKMKTSCTQVLAQNIEKEFEAIEREVQGKEQGEETDIHLEDIKPEPQEKEFNKGNLRKRKRKKRSSKVEATSKANVAEQENETGLISESNEPERRLRLLVPDDVDTSAINESVVNENTSSVKRDSPTKRRKLLKTVKKHNKRTNAPNSKDGFIFEDSIYKCAEEGCSFTSKFKGSLVRHRKQQHDRTHVRCKTCGAMVPTNDMDEHIQMLHSKPISCPKCDKQLKTSAELRLHMLNYHTDPTTYKYECTHCKKRFHHRSNFVGHLDSHNDVKNWVCSLCHKGFSFQSSMLRHIKKCTGEKSKKKTYPCEECGLVFKLKDYLNQHMIGKHSGETNYICKCNRSFAWRGSLVNHRKRCKIALQEDLMRKKTRTDAEVEREESQDNGEEIMRSPSKQEINYVTDTDPESLLREMGVHPISTINKTVTQDAKANTSVFSQSTERIAESLVNEASHIGNISGSAITPRPHVIVPVAQSIYTPAPTSGMPNRGNPQPMVQTRYQNLGTHSSTNVTYNSDSNLKYTYFIENYPNTTGNMGTPNETSMRLPSVRGKVESDDNIMTTSSEPQALVYTDLTQATPKFGNY